LETGLSRQSTAAILTTKLTISKKKHKTAQNINLNTLTHDLTLVKDSENLQKAKPTTTVKCKNFSYACAYYCAQLWSTTQHRTVVTRMWTNAQRDGRPAKHKWRPLFNAVKFGRRSLLDAAQ